MPESRKVRTDKIFKDFCFCITKKLFKFFLLTVPGYYLKYRKFTNFCFQEIIRIFLKFFIRLG